MSKSFAEHGVEHDRVQHKESRAVLAEYHLAGGVGSRMFEEVLRVVHDA